MLRNEVIRAVLIVVIYILHMQNILMDDMPIAILFIRRDYQITAANKQCHILFGYEPKELIGQQMDVLVPPASLERHHQEAEKYWQNACSRQLGIGRDLSGVRKDGSLVSIEIGLYPDQDQIMVLVVDGSARHIKYILHELVSLADHIKQSSS